ncbi:GreA/GreB family elongation factor [Flavobacteriaceae bacterium XHP0103]|uniref:3-oxoacyl-ACP synthase n=1 Tax=Marixanthotalea marina TaxID=2844359 RepID=UPI002989B69E|nr:3-oxoacyl-ACP synthase [Marixanthotalea marina]MBU3820509.1 GreA/GreB family elongation factor [Marixanthotalea marina]
MKNSHQLKVKLQEHCLQFIENKLQTIQNTIKEIQESLTSETKSSAGDKHETGRAMLQLEREKAGNQLAEILKTKSYFSKINFEKTSQTIGVGSMVFTSKSNYFIAISAGEITAENTRFFAVSPNTPIGKLLIGKTVGDTVNFREQAFKIQSIY